MGGKCNNADEGLPGSSCGHWVWGSRTLSVAVQTSIPHCHCMHMRRRLGVQSYLMGKFTIDRERTVAEVIQTGYVEQQLNKPDVDWAVEAVVWESAAQFRSSQV